MAAKKWSKVQVAIQSALAAAISITAITKANPGVATYSGADPVNGDYAILKVQGMHQLNKKVVRFANVNGAATRSSSRTSTRPLRHVHLGHVRSDHLRHDHGDRDRPERVGRGLRVPRHARSTTT